ncbi:unnamed protein product [Heterobilharzia americana]|nr:unnamed protein product [Heterobilharzia americana]
MSFTTTHSGGVYSQVNCIYSHLNDVSHQSAVNVKKGMCSGEDSVSDTVTGIKLRQHEQDSFPIFHPTTSPYVHEDEKGEINTAEIHEEVSSSLSISPLHFMVNCQPTNELKQFVNFVQSLWRQKYNRPRTSTLISDLGDSSDQNGGCSEDVYSSPDSWAFDCVYNDSMTNTTSKASRLSHFLSHQQSNPSWETETGASNVSHVYPKSKEYPSFQEITPSHWTNTPRWCIPQLEVRITAHLTGRKRSRQSLVIGSRRPINLDLLNSSTPVSPRLRLVCDPTTTLVNELMLEALANDLIPHEFSLDANQFQLRLQGRAELLRPEARLCDCYQVQLCHRLDQPLKLILEPKDVDQPSAKKDFSDIEQFNPQNYFMHNRPTPTEEDIFISYSVFQNALQKLRSCVVENYAQVDSETWLKEVHCTTSSLSQSVKAVLTAVCYGIAFSDVINALGNVQVCIMDIIYDIGLNHKVVGVKRHGNNSNNDNATGGNGNTTQENWFSSIRRKQTKPSSLSIHNFQPNKNLNKTLVNLKRDIKPQSRKKLHNFILSLNKNLLSQLNAFFIWRQVSISVKPQLINNHTVQHNNDNDDSSCSISFPNMEQLYHKTGRPKAVLLTDYMQFDDLQVEKLCEQDREIKSSSDCPDAVVIGLIAIHNPPPRKTIGVYNSIMSGNNTNTTSALSSSSTSQSAFVNNSTRTDGYYCVRIGLLYAGRPLGKVYPSELSNYRTNSFGNCYTSSPYIHQSKEYHWANNHTLSVDSQQKHTRDYFISDPGRYQTIQSGFPKVLQFDQWFKFPSFAISQLPREAMLTISLFLCKKLNTENSDVDGTLVGWVNFPLFDINGRLKQNTAVVGLWPPSEFMHDYRPTWSQSNTSPDCPLVQLCFPEYQYEIEFPIIKFESPLETTSDRLVSSFNSLCSDAKQSIIEAKSAILLQTLNPELSFKSVDASLIAYSAASSSVHRSSRREHVPIPVLQLAALNSMLTSSNQYSSFGSSINGGSTSGSGSVVTGAGNGNNSNCNSNNNSGIINNSNIPACSINSVTCCLPCPPAITIEVLWNLRHSICDIPEAMIALVISCLVNWPQITKQNSKNATQEWSWIKLLKEVYSLLTVTPVPYPGLVLRLLSPDVADQGIRHWATRALSLLSSDSLLLYLPQITEAVNHDLYLDYSGLVSLILHRAAFSMRFANSLYWYLYPMLNQSQPSSEWKLQRFRFIQAALYWNADTRLRTMWKRQEEMIHHLSVTATKVKQARPNAAVREEILYTHLKQFMSSLSENCLQSSDQASINDASLSSSKSRHWSNDKSTIEVSKLDVDSLEKISVDNVIGECQVSQYDLGLRMPYNPGLLSHRLDITACSYFTSFTCPLRLVFHALDAGTEPFMVMFKAGDDLRLDSLICQLTFLMDRIWLDAGLDLRMIHFRIIPTEEQKGFIELISECSTLRQIQQQVSNITELDYKRALDNFLRSLAGCCVATYILGVGDRHNDNIMIRYSGHVFHVDFSKVFGNSQTFVGIKRDRVPFVLTQDMLHVLNTYSKDMTDSLHGLSNSSGFGYTPGQSSTHPQQGIQLFIEKCCEAYNLLRHRSYQLISLLELSLSMNIPGLNRDCVRFVLRALRPELNDREASQYFTELVRKTLHSKSSSFNFFVHGLAQVKQATLGGGGVSGTNTNISNLSDRGSPSRMNNMISDHSALINTTNNHSNSSITGRFVNDSKLRSTPPTNNSLLNCPGTGQIFSFNPKRFTNISDGNMDAIVVEIAVKKKTDDKHSDYYFPMNIWRENCRVPTRIYRRLSDLEELETRLQDCFPNSIATKTVSHIMNALNSINVSSSRSQDHVQSLVDSLLSDDEIVCKSDVVYTFFHSVLFDERFAAEDMSLQGINPSSSSSSSSRYWIPASFPDRSPEKSKEYTTPLLIPSSFHFSSNNPSDIQSTTHNVNCLPAVQIQLYLSENSRRLDVLIKHARCLYIPGSSEPPDVYIKVYLLSGRRRKTTKRKTGIVRRSTCPSFNVMFSYDLIPNDTQCGFVEVSAWHAVHIGENIPIGQIYVQLKSINPGHAYAHWYTLCSDPACLS